MKLDPATKLPETAEGPEAFTRFRNAVKKVLSAPKPDVDQRVSRRGPKSKKTRPTSSSPGPA
jgi:hypothetical protein